MSGKGVIEHNRRTYIAENVDPERTHLNIEYCYTPIEQAYHTTQDTAVPKTARSPAVFLPDSVQPVSSHRYRRSFQACTGTEHPGRFFQKDWNLGDYRYDAVIF